MMNVDLTSRQREIITSAVHAVQQRIRWKPGKGVEHLKTRMHYGHLPSNASIVDYHAIITSVVSADQAELYVFKWRNDLYPTIVAEYEDIIWLVMFSESGILETAFPPTDPEEYLSDSRFYYLGLLTEWLS